MPASARQEASSVEGKTPTNIDKEIEETVAQIKAEQALLASVPSECVEEKQEESSDKTPQQQARGEESQNLNGIAQPLPMAEFINGMARIEQNWSDYGNAEARGDAIGEVVNSILQSLSIPTVEIIPVGGLPSLGSFDNELWVVYINLELLNQNCIPRADEDVLVNLGEEGVDITTLSLNDVPALVELLSHELRHVQQWYDMARLEAQNQGLSATAESLQQKLRIPPPVIQSALNNAFNSQNADDVSRQAQAQDFYNSVYGRFAQGRNATLQILIRLQTQRGPLVQNVLNAAAQYQQNPTDQNGFTFFKAKTELSKFDQNTGYQGIVTAYRNLAEEKDAFAVGAIFRENYIREVEPPSSCS